MSILCHLCHFNCVDLNIVCESDTSIPSLSFSLRGYVTANVVWPGQFWGVKGIKEQWISILIVLLGRMWVVYRDEGDDWRGKCAESKFFVVFSGNIKENIVNVQKYRPDQFWLARTISFVTGT